MRTKLFYLSALIVIIAGACVKDDEQIKEVPQEIIRTSLDPVLYQRIVDKFAEGVNACKVYPFIFTDTIQKQIILTDSSEVFITFVGEKAYYKNTVGWYSYKIGASPKRVEDINIHILFPNVSGKGEGGELLEGDMLQLGNKKFPKGTVIGFFLIVKGWNYGTIDYTNQTHYTDLLLNPENHQQHILFKEKTGKNIILGFEDQPSGIGDKDYNDILFIISDNKKGFESIYFDLKGIPSF